MTDEIIMHRCLQLAGLGAGTVAPNPMVGAVLLHDGKIIGEGYHQKYGEAHAEVNCINMATQNGNRGLIAQSVLYVSLEPCSHFGKTPPCTDLIIKNKIPKVVIGCRDPFKEVDGKGVEKLIAAGVEVKMGVLEKDCKELNKRFFTFHTVHRPYIILKWAETGDGKIANPSKPRQIGATSDHSPNRLFISNEYSNRLVHKWRCEEASILVGTNTALSDDPELTTRLWPGSSPVRLVIDMDLKLPSTLKIFNQQQPTIVFNTKKNGEEGDLQYYQVAKDVNVIHQIANALYQLDIQSVIVEGGAKLLQSFIDDGMWDEARIIINEELIINNGLAAPVLKSASRVSEQKLFSDLIEVYKHSA